MQKTFLKPVKFLKPNLLSVALFNSVKKTSLPAIITSVISAAILLFLALSAFAQSSPYPGITPLKPKSKNELPSVALGKRKQLSSTKIAVASLKGIRFVSSAKDFDKNGISIPGITFNGLPVLDKPPFISKIKPFLGKPLTFKDLNYILSLTESTYSKKGFPFVDAVAPSQNVTSGVLQIVVVSYRISSIKVSGNKHFSGSLVKSLSGITPGRNLTSDKLLSGLSWLNRSPFMHTNALLSPGSTPGSMLLTILVRDVNPLRFYLGADNQGIPSLGINEWNAGINYGNLFGLGQMFSYQFTEGFNGRYTANSLNYEVPFSWKGRAGVNAFYATAVPYLNPGLDETGKNEGVSLSYKQRFSYYASSSLTLSQSLGLGYDLKTTNNDLAFGGVQVFASAAQIDQFPLYYSLKEKDRYGSSSLDNRLVYSPGHMSPDNSDSSFAAIFTGAKSRYIYDNLNLLRRQILPLNASFSSSLDFQAASANLLYTEQLAAGGIYTAPGYSPDTATGSRGVILREELNLPPLNIAPAIFNGAKAYYPLPVNLGLFWSYADLSQAQNVTSYTGLPDTAVLESIGPDLRMDVAGRFSLRFELGWRLRHLPYGSYGKGLFEDLEITGVL